MLKLVNPVLCTEHTTLPLPSGTYMKAPQISLVRLEPSYLFEQIAISIQWRDDSGILSNDSMFIGRDTIAIWILCPPCDPNHRISLSISAGSSLIYHCALRITGEKANKLLLGRFKRKVASEYYQTRYWLQSLPFEEMLDRTQEALHKCKAKLVFVTGSVGKTTTKELLSDVLEQAYAVCKSTDSWNFPHEICSQIFLNTSWGRIFVIEAALSSWLETLGDHLVPDALVFTNLGAAHTAYYGTVDNIGLAKAQLAKRMGRCSTIYFNADIPEIRQSLKSVLDRSRQEGPRLVGFSENLNVDDVACVQYNECLQVIDYRDNTDYCIPHKVKPCLYRSILSSAYALAKDFGVTPDAVQNAIINFSGVPFRADTQSFRNVTVISDSYNANPLSLLGLKSILVDYHIKGKRICAILGDMLDLGSDSMDLHKLVLQNYQAVCAQLYVVGKTFSECSVEHNRNTLSFPTTNSLLDWLDIELLISQYDIIAIKGSHAMGLIRVSEQICTKAAEIAGEIHQLKAV